MKIRETHALGTGCSWPQHMWVPETKHRPDPALFTSPLETLTLIVHLAEVVYDVQRLLSAVFKLFSLLTNMLHKAQPKVTTGFHSCENQTSSLWKSTSFSLAYHSPSDIPTNSTKVAFNLLSFADPYKIFTRDLDLHTVTYSVLQIHHISVVKHIARILTSWRSRYIKLHQPGQQEKITSHCLYLGKEYSLFSVKKAELQRA